MFIILFAVEQSRMQNGFPIFFLQPCNVDVIGMRAGQKQLILEGSEIIGDFLKRFSLWPL